MAKPKNDADRESISKTQFAVVDSIEATFSRDGQRHAWLLDNRISHEYSARERDMLIVDSISLCIAETGRDCINIEVDGALQRINLGDKIK